MTNKELLEQASKLTELAEQLEIIHLFIDCLETDRIKGDTFSYKFHMSKGSIGKIGDNLENIQKKIEEVSDCICPDDVEAASDGE